MKKDMRNYIKDCEVCQRNKSLLKAPVGLLQPLPILEAIWRDISIDFIEGLPVSQGKSVIFVAVDRLSKHAHFMALSYLFTTVSVAQTFFDNVFKLHGFPRSIVSDRDRVFLSKFWKELFALQQVELLMSTAYHPQTDGQTEAVNKCVETYLRYMTGDQPKQWYRWLPLVESWYNTTYYSSTGVTPFEVVCSQSPYLHIPYITGDSQVEAVDRSLSAREECIKLLKFHLQRAQDRMKMQANKKRTNKEYDVGDLVYVKLQPYRQSSVVYRSCQKLAPKYFGPFQILARVGKVAYKIQLPEGSKIHPVFHISQLKKHIGHAPVTSTLLDIDDQGHVRWIEN